MVRPIKKKLDPQKQAEIIANARRAQEQRQQGYREQALALFPHVCGRCGREFSAATLRELTVHHRDGDHMNNPPDGSNWELLCLYCHDNEHQKYLNTSATGGATRERHREEPLGHRPFEGLANLLKPEGEVKEPE